ncbi:hypothetical protein RRG08_049980 [Elysia crispata]|uniref:Uncharacterized protein n=1 Tax=Elysia crispata TaxID=231223 RepID=A0AAE1BA54_9GAST|nr:hypothetical protein RRG08_049980 [Elysia crispata]
MLIKNDLQHMELISSGTVNFGAQMELASVTITVARRDTRPCDNSPLGPASFRLRHDPKDGTAHASHVTQQF